MAWHLSGGIATSVAKDPVRPENPDETAQTELVDYPDIECGNNSRDLPDWLVKERPPSAAVAHYELICPRHLISVTSINP
jgi:hypothetical protein